MHLLAGTLLAALVACHGSSVHPADTTCCADSDPDTPGESAPPDSEPPGETDAPDTDVPVERAPFSIVVLPDTQEYAASYPEIFLAQASWVIEQGDIAFVLHVGDMTDDNSPEQWRVAEQAMGMMDGQVPYLLNLGNHDMGTGGNAEDRFTRVDDYFPPARFDAEPWYGGNQDGTSANYHVVFEAAGMSFLVLSLEFGPSDETLAWASGVIEEHPNHRVILVTHCYLMDDDTLVGPTSGFSPHNYGIDALGVNDGEEIWDEFASRHENLFLVLCGHVTGDGSGHLASQGVAGNTVHQVLANHQHEAFGGNGWLRILAFQPEEDLVAVTTYSPVVAAQEGEDEAYRLDPEYSFDLDYDMSLD